MGGAWRTGGLSGLWGMLLLCALPALAAPLSTEEASPEVRVVIDVSGSMREHDPEQLAAQALELLVALLPEGTRAGVWTFGERIANPLPVGRVDAGWRRQAEALAPQLRGRAPYTDIEAALEAAAPLPAHADRHLVLITDGMVDLPPWRGAKPASDTASRQRLLAQLAPRLASAETRVHAIAFSAAADASLVEQLARRTGGLSMAVATPEALLGAFLAIVDRIFPQDRAPLHDAGFVIEPGLEGFSALLLRWPEAPAPVLIAPDGRRYTAEAPPEGGRWQHQTHYDLVQVPRPAVGQWRLEGEVAAGSRVALSAPLQLRLAPLPGTLYQGFATPLEAWLAREGAPLPAKQWPAHLRLSAELRDATGAVLAATELRPEGARFVGRLPGVLSGGTAQLVVRAEGQGLQRQRVQAVNVLPAVTATHAVEAARVVLQAAHPALNRDNTRLHGQLAGQRLDAVAVDEKRWVIALPALDDRLARPLTLRGQVTGAEGVQRLHLPPLTLFPDGPTALDLAAERPTLQVARFHESLAPERAQPAPSDPAAWRAALTEQLPAWLAARGREGRQWFIARRESGGPLTGREAIGLAGALLLAVGWYRLRLRRRARHHYREEPHV